MPSMPQSDGHGAHLAFAPNEHYLRRRTVLLGGVSLCAYAALSPKLLRARSDAQLIVNDITRVNAIVVDRIANPTSAEEIQELVGSWLGPISIGGGRYSMGGQIAAENSLHLDMRNFNQLVRLDPEQRVARVQAGMTWRELQELIDPHDLSVKIMQSYSNFTVGGSLSVNAHGRYMGLGPIVNSVRSIQLISADGAIIEVSPAENSELFYGAIGGYGALGVIGEVELDLVANEKIERRVDYVSISEYANFVRDQILDNPDAVLHNANLDIPYLDGVTSVTWFHSDQPLTSEGRLTPRDVTYSMEAWKLWALAELPGAQFLRRIIFDPITYTDPAVVWRNHEASLDVAALGEFATEDFTHALQEYFIPVGHYEAFAREMSEIFLRNDVNVLNVSIRHSLADTKSLMSWASEDVFSFVLYYKQSSGDQAFRDVGNWTRELIEAALDFGGTYYLPYQLHATEEQFARAYPNASRFLALKTGVDPDNRFRNKLWDRYLRA